MKKLVDIYHLKFGFSTFDGIKYARVDENENGDQKRVYDVVAEREFVATVLAVDLEDAWEKTNHTPWNPSWHIADGVQSHKDRQRSSMVGDLFEMDGRSYIVAGNGFIETHSMD